MGYNKRSHCKHPKKHWNNWRTTTTLFLGRGSWVGLQENKEAEKYTQIPIYFVRDCRSLIINTVETYKKTIAKDFFLLMLHQSWLVEKLGISCLEGCGVPQKIYKPQEKKGSPLQGMSDAS